MKKLFGGHSKNPSHPTSKPSAIKAVLEQNTKTLEQELIEYWEGECGNADGVAASTKKDFNRLAPRLTVTIDDKPFFKSAPAAANGARLNRVVSTRLLYNVDLRMAGKADTEQLDAVPEPADNSHEHLATFPCWIVKSLPSKVVHERMASLGWGEWSGPGEVAVSQRQDACIITLRVLDDNDESSGDASHIVSMWDSTRYFVLRSGAKVVGFGFGTREEANTFKSNVEAGQQKATEYCKRQLAAMSDSSGTASTSSARAREEAEKAARESVKSDAHANDANEQLKCMRNAVQSVVRALNPEVTSRVDKLFADTASDTKELAHVSEALFTQAVGKDCATTRVFNVINQSVVLIAKFHLTLLVPQLAGKTRDVREKEGWKVTCHIAPDVITVKHTRREQSLEGVPASEFFWFEWDLWMLFSAPDAKQCHNAKLKVSKLGFGPETTDQTKEKINNYLGKAQLGI